MGKKIRHFEGHKNISDPFYIYEKNNSETLSYANDINKRGRCNYACVGGSSVPNQADAITQTLPAFIEIKRDYAPRLIDKFFGKYAVLLDTPFMRQTIKKDLAVTGNLSVEKELESQSAVSVTNSQTGYSVKNTVKANGDASVGAYLNGLLVNEMVLHTDGRISFYKQNSLIAQLKNNGLYCSVSQATTSYIGSLLLSGNNIDNVSDTTDDGAININYSGYNSDGSKFRNFNVYNGKKASVPVFQVVGKSNTAIVTGAFLVKNSGIGAILLNTTYAKTDKRLLNTLQWQDNKNEEVAYIGYYNSDSFDYTICNKLGSIVVRTNGYLDVIGELKVNGVSISSTYVTQTSFTSELKKKVNTVSGKQLSTEDFTTEYKKKLDSISQGTVGSEASGFALAKEVTEALKTKLSISSNLSDLKDKAQARTNMDVFSKTEANSAFLKVSKNLLELVTLTADEVNGLTTEQITEKKAEKQATVRHNIDAEKKGTGDLKLTKTSNLSDLPDKTQARKNLSVYSISELDKKFEGYLPSNAAYTGAVFTTDHKTKLEGIKTGVFAGTDNEGKAIAQTEGYVLTSSVVKELGKKANLLLDGYNESQKKTIAGNIGVYIKSESDAKYASVEELFQDFITFLVKQGKNTTEAQKILRDKLDAPSKSDVSNNYLRKDSKLSDLVLANNDAKKAACTAIGAAFASEYQTLVKDTGWIQMSNSGSRTDTRSLFARQIGNIVCIQGSIHNQNHDGEWWGGVVAIIPNQIQPPKFSIKNSLCTYNNDHKYNRGASYVIWGGDRRLIMYESGWNEATEINFTYMV